MIRLHVKTSRIKSRIFQYLYRIILIISAVFNLRIKTADISQTLIYSRNSYSLIVRSASHRLRGRPPSSLGGRPPSSLGGGGPVLKICELLSRPIYMGRADGCIFSRRPPHAPPSRGGGPPREGGLPVRGARKYLRPREGRSESISEYEKNIQILFTIFYIFSFY